MDMFFLGMFGINLALFLAHLYFLFMYKPATDFRGVVKKWQLHGFLLVLSIMAVALFYVAFMGAITPDTNTISGSGVDFTYTTNVSDASTIVALLNFVNVIFALNSLFAIIGFLKEFKLFTPKRFKDKNTWR